MERTKSNLHIKHDLLGKIFYIKVMGGNAELHYERHGDKELEIVSTTVPEASRKFGIAGKLMEEAISFAKEQQLLIKPTCSFAASYLEEHPEYHSQLA
ncbi:GNAT family N-acetyltransferase [Marinoscillum sp.]|uniref:GNAT family N-acetyltransferase n=1 Tax=Marinoscillum sp. TaxID=2024838 RepID=UPI003BABF94B